MSDAPNTPGLPERCSICRHTLEDHETDGWACDCCNCPWKNPRVAAMSDPKTEWHEGFTDGFLAGKVDAQPAAVIDPKTDAQPAPETDEAREPLTPERYREIEKNITHMRELRAKQDALFGELLASLRHQLIKERGACKHWGRGPNGGAGCVLWLDHDGEHEFPPGATWVKLRRR